MKGIAVSMYDKFDQAAVLIDMVRSDWTDDVYVTVCSNHPDGRSELAARNVDIDEYVQGGRVSYHPDMDSPRRDINLVARILDSIAASCRACLDGPVDSVMHLHADAWPLSEDGYDQLLAQMDRREKRLAVRGHGLEWRTPMCIVGQVMDQFFLVDADFARKRRLFEVNPLSYLPHLSIHTCLLLVFLGRATLDEMWYYSTMDDDRQWDGEPINLPYTGVRPGVFNPEYQLLHVATDEFPASLGKAVQAHWLNEHGPWESDVVSAYVDEHVTDDVFEQLATHEEQLNTRLRRYGFIPERFGREFTKMQARLDDARERPVRTFVENALKRGVRDPLFTMLSKLPESRFDNLGDPERRQFYYDSRWNKDTIPELYRRELDPEDFPALMRRWYEDER